MSRLRHEKGVRAGAGSGVHRAQASKPLSFSADEERKGGGTIHRKSGGSVFPEKVDNGEGPNRLGRKRGGAVSGPGTHGTDATPDRGMKFGTKLQGLRMDEPDKSEQRRQFKQGGEVKNWIKGAIKHPGAEKRAAAKAGESTHDYMESHKNDGGKSGARARLGLRLSAMSKHKD